MKRPLNKYFIIATLGFIIWIVETAAFGFNQKPANGLEALLDLASMGMIFYGIIGDLLTNVEIHKNYYKYKETNIKTRSVEIKGDKPNVVQTTNVNFESKDQADDFFSRLDNQKPKKDAK